MSNDDARTFNPTAQPFDTELLALFEQADQDGSHNELLLALTRALIALIACRYKDPEAIGLGTISNLTTGLALDRGRETSH